MKILDLSAGNRAVWFKKDHPFATFLDRRPEVRPTIICDTRKDLSKIVGRGFDLFVFDPPHCNSGKNSNMSKAYGYHTTEQILELIEKTGQQAHKIGKKNALMALKWNSHDIRLERVLDLLPGWEPLFGHLTKDGPRSQTYWVMLRRLDRSTRLLK